MAGFLLMVGVVIVMGAMYGFQSARGDKNYKMSVWKSSFFLVLYYFGAFMAESAQNFHGSKYAGMTIILGVVALIFFSFLWELCFKAFNWLVKKYYNSILG